MKHGPHELPQERDTQFVILVSHFHHSMSYMRRVKSSHDILCGEVISTCIPIYSTEREFSIQHESKLPGISKIPTGEHYPTAHRRSKGKTQGKRRHTSHSVDQLQFSSRSVHLLVGMPVPAGPVRVLVLVLELLAFLFVPEVLVVAVVAAVAVPMSKTGCKCIIISESC